MKPETPPQPAAGDSAASSTGFDVRAPAIQLPKGGGAMHGIGEKFGTNPVTGTGSMSVPIATSPGRSGFGPQLSLAYDSGAGNGVFGFGWTLSLPAITRKTDKGLPRYLDAVESDVFILSGAEDLVPIDEQDVDGYRVRRYRPRIEGLYARIERWSRPGAPADVHWRSISKDNVLTLYGTDDNSRIADPLDPRRIFSWLISETRDDKGNAIQYRYKAEDGQSVDLGLAHERNRGARDDRRRTANRYLKRIRYGNRVPLLDPSGRRPRFVDSSDADWMFEVVFDYGDHAGAAPRPGDDETRNADGSLAFPWPRRPDPFSSCRAGFEVRTLRLCRRILMFHHFPDQAEVGRDCLVRSTDLAYPPAPSADDPGYSFLQAVTQTGHRRHGDGDGDDRRSLPPLEFDYSVPQIQDDVQDVDPASLENLPVGLDGATWRWTDLHGEGVPGILTEQAGAWFYKRNRSTAAQARFAPLEAVALAPNAALGGGAEFMDLAGDGEPDLVVMDGPSPGFYEHDQAEGWRPFRPFTSRLNRDPRDPNLRLVDLDGDGHADVLITEDDALVWHPSLAEQGFGPARRVANSIDEESGPRVVFADGTQSIFLADMTGDGLSDIVRVRNADICYWPNLGYGRFGARIGMDHAPRFDHPDQFDQARIRLADIDGSGTTDIIYLHREGVRLYFNQCGNSWGRARPLKVFPRVDALANIVPIDLLGNGTACLVWSSPLAADGSRAMHYVNLMGDTKPHLLVKTTNNLGAETRIAYAASTRFYLQDKRDGKPWITRLPFPVHVVERVDTWDHVSRNRFSTRYAYHHGYFDGVEREFRGFGMVEQWDTEQFAALADGKPVADNVAAHTHVPPVHSKTWFHTGVHLGRERVSHYFATGRDGYFRAPGLDDGAARAQLLPDTVLPAGLSLDEEREACRALKGSMLRQEIYADDAGPNASLEQIRRARTPYSVVEQNFTVRILRRRGSHRHAVFCTHAREAISHHYERDPGDPRIQHTLTLEADDFGNVLKQAVVSYGRRAHGGGPAALPESDRARQAATLITYTENRVTNAIDSTDDHRNPLPSESVTFELTGYPATGPAQRYQACDFIEAAPDGGPRHRFAPPEVPYEASAEGSRRRRPIEHLRTLYRRDDLDGLLPLGALQALALPGESYKLAFTPGLLAQVYQRPRADQPPDILLPDPPAVLGDRGGYRSGRMLKADGRFPRGDADDHWWLPSGQPFFSPAPADDAASESAQARRHFFQPRRYRDAFGQDTLVAFDADDLLMTEIRDPLGNRTNALVNDYRVLLPRLVSDPNGNQTEVAFDILGLVAGTAVKGKPAPAPAQGDTLRGFRSDLTQEQIAAFFAADDPQALALELLRDAGTRTIYDLNRFHRSRLAHPDDPAQWQPVCAAMVVRETHPHDPLPPQGARAQLNFSYSDGFGREIQKKLQAEPGPLTDGGPPANRRWVGSGWTIFNNKGKPVRQYEPFFSATHGFEFGVQSGVSPVLFYDPAMRVVATLHPNHTYEKVVFDPWRQTTYDVNDSCAPRGGQTGDPRTDPDIGGYVARYFSQQPSEWQTWYSQRIDGALGRHERAAAVRAAAHADTPTSVHFDALGRPILTLARNRVVCPGHALDGTEECVASRVELDIEGNQRAVLDERRLAVDYLPTGATERRAVMRYAYDMLGNRIHQRGVESGARWMLNDVTGKPIRAWDSRGHDFTIAYDALRRPVAQFVRGTSTESDPRTLGRDLLVDRIEYGETVAGGEALNLRTRVYRHFDAAGLAVNARLDADGNPDQAYDFKGNLLHSTRRLARDYKGVPDWSLPAEPQLEAELFAASTRYDALNRAIQSVAAHSSQPQAGHPNRINVVQPVFNAANLLERVDVWLECGAEPAGLLDPDETAPSAAGVADIDYDAKGQRQRIAYKNGASTAYGYDPLTFRLTRLLTRRDATDFPADDPRPPPAGRPGRQVQNLRYTYDPFGNVTHIEDDAQQTVYFSNQCVEPDNDYVYDALYQLVQATGREHLGQGGAPVAYTHDDTGRVGLPQPGDGGAMGSYVERYVYDAVGNILQLQHRGRGPAHPGWTRGYDYRAAGPAGQAGNRLGGTTLNPGHHDGPSETYRHDAHGNMLGMPHLGMHWDYKDQFHRADMAGGGVAHYAYDAAGQRVRKVWEKAPGLTEERIYLDNVEIFRRHSGADGAGATTLERETLHVMDDKRRIAMVETRTLDTQGDDQAPRQLIRYQLANLLGSACLELDDGARIISYEEYAPYGSSTYQAVRKLTQAPKRYRYAGKERDEESGFYRLGARYYAPWLGRWISPDPAGLVDGPNLYRYARNCPAVLSDPQGTDPPDPRNYETFESFSADAPAPYAMDYLEQLWQASHPTLQCSADPATRVPVEGTVSEDDQKQLASGGVYFMPDNTASIGTPVHLIVLPILSARLAMHGVPNMIEMPTLMGGSKSGQSVGFIDLAVFVPPQGAGPVSMLEAHVYDLKPGGSSSSVAHSQQVINYVQHFDQSGLGIAATPQIGTALYDIAAQHPDILEPIEVPGTMGRAYIGLQLTAPGIIEYHLGVRPIPIPVPQPKEVEVEERRRVRVDDTEYERHWFPHPAPLTREQQQQAAASTLTVGTVLIFGLMILGSPLGV